MDWRILVPVIAGIIAIGGGILIKWLIAEKKVGRAAVEAIDGIVNSIIAKQSTGEIKVGNDAYKILLAFDSALNNALGLSAQPTLTATPVIEAQVKTAIVEAVTASGNDTKTMQREIRSTVKDQLEAIAGNLLLSKAAQRKARSIIVGIGKKIKF